MSTRFGLCASGRNAILLSSANTGDWSIGTTTRADTNESLSVCESAGWSRIVTYKQSVE